MLMASALIAYLLVALVTLLGITAALVGQRHSAHESAT